jgi:hypothetical protein
MRFGAADEGENGRHTRGFLDRKHKTEL